MTVFHRLAFAAVAVTLSLTGAEAGEAWKKLLAPAELARLVEQDAPILVDIRAPEAYAEGHLEGAINVPYPAWRGPAENPGKLIDEATLTRNLQQLGIEPDSEVVVTYQGSDATDFGAAARVYWTLKSAGVDRIAILNGGVNAWKTEGLPLSTAEASGMPSDAEFSFSETWLAEEDDVTAVVEGEGDAVLIDARPGAFFRGEKKHDAARWAGTLRSALNLDQFAWFRDETGSRFEADPEAIRERARQAGWTPGQPIVSFCNTGHWAATNWFALSELAGIENVKLYPESMVGWTLTHGKVAAN